jgi:hypothetical protein
MMRLSLKKNLFGLWVLRFGDRELGHFRTMSEAKGYANTVLKKYGTEIPDNFRVTKSKY